MADSTTDGKESQQVGEDAGSSNDAIVFDIGVVQPPDSPYSNDTENERAASLHLQEAIQVKEDTLPGCDDSDNSADIMTQETDKPDIQSVDVLSEGPGDPPEGKDHVQSPGGEPAFTGDAERIDLESHRQKIDETELDDSNQQDSVILNERSLEVKVKHGKAQQLEDGGTGVELSVGDGTKEMDMYNGLMPVESSLVIEPQEGKLSSEEKDVGLFSNNEIKEKCLNQKMPGLELVTEIETKRELGNASSEMEAEPSNEVEGDFVNPEQNVRPEADMKTASNIFLPDKNAVVGNESGTEEDQAAFMKELETFHKERCLEFKPPKFYGEPLNCLKLWRAVIRLGGYEQVTACKLWRQVGESFNPPKTCTTVSWTFRGFYEKALLEYEKHKMRSGELPFTDASFMEPSSNGNQAGLSQSSGSGRARRDAAARAMQGWHTQRLLGNGEVGDPIIKDKNSVSIPKREKQLKSVGLLKRRKLSPVDHPLQVARLKALKPQLDSMVVDIGAPADWVKINVQRTKDCFEVYALVPGLLREEVRVQSDPAGRLVISGQPEQLDNPWGVTPFKKVVSLPSRIDPHQTSAVVTLHGQLFVRVPFEQSDM